MKTVHKTFIFLTILLTSSAFAQDTTVQSTQAHDHSTMNHSRHKEATVTQPKAKPTADCENTITVRVDGLVCDFCARALEKVFNKHDEVENIKVDLNQGTVLVKLKPKQNLDEATLTKVITDSGYNMKSIQRGCDA